MLDLGRILVLAWAIFCALRARAWLGAALVVATAYVFALSIASGIAVRESGPMSPLLAVLLALIGPSALPRGPLTHWPFGWPVVRAPAVVDGLACVAVLLAARRIAARVEHLPQFSERTHRLSRAALALVLVAVFQGFAVLLRVLPAFLDGEAGPIDRNSPPADHSIAGKIAPSASTTLVKTGPKRL